MAAVIIEIAGNGVGVEPIIGPDVFPNPRNAFAWESGRLLRINARQDKIRIFLGDGFFPFSKRRIENVLDEAVVQRECWPEVCVGYFHHYTGNKTVDTKAHQTYTTRNSPSMAITSPTVSSSQADVA